MLPIQDPQIIEEQSPRRPLSTNVASRQPTSYSLPDAMEPVALRLVDDGDCRANTGGRRAHIH